MKNFELFKKRFWKKVRQGEPDECWPWLGTVRDSDKSYGRCQFDGRKLYAHRVAFWLSYEKQPGEYAVCHSCDNPICCNPNHLWLGTRDDNNKDKNIKGRQSRGSTHGMSILDEQKVKEIVDLLRDSKYTFDEISDIYHVSVETISSIQNGNHWVHVTGGGR